MLEQPEAVAPDTGSFTGLISGIISDTQQLVKQQVNLVRVEIRQDIKRAGDAAKFISVGLLVALLGVQVLAFGLVYLLQYLAPSLPVWTCFAAVGGAGLLGGLALIFAGWKAFSAKNPLPDQSLAGLQENMQWLTNGKK